MWTRKAAFTFTGGIALILIGMMISNHQMMILGIAFIAFIVVNSWVSGHGDVEVQRTLSADNLYKGDDLYVELLVTNRSRRKTQQLEVYDNVPHEMKLRSGLNQMRLNLKPGESARIRYVLRCPLRGHYSIGPVSLRYRNTFNLSVDEMYVDHHSDIIIFPQIRDVEEAFIRSRTAKMYTGSNNVENTGARYRILFAERVCSRRPVQEYKFGKAFARTGRPDD
ncbi:MAG: hypothetical protein CM15mP9_3610 [Methanobacteriota archaeon]|nr:MAG: hypothetical protein CM15mP9_3610 [Euryarchaeota archaeon]